MIRRLLSLPLAFAVIATSLQGQEPLDAVDAAHRAARIALTGDLGMPALPPLLPDSPMDTILFADRVPVGQGTSASTAEGAPPLINGFLPAGEGGTGTAYPEIFKYQIPDGYDPGGTPHPMVVAYHGFGGSAFSPSDSSLIDEECNARGWIYMSPTGVDDKLFGSPLSQQNTEAAMQWMIDNFHVDVDRIYMVGFSMGGGIVSNFAARRRDPNGLMIAAVGTVSASLDWTQVYNLSGGALMAWMQQPANFGGSPVAEPFRYQQASALHFDPASYPPTPGILLDDLTMATNLEFVPTYLTYDTGDTISFVPHENEVFHALLSGHSVPIQKIITSGTINPANGQPAPHSWAVLDEVELFDFFASHVVNRTPEDFEGQLDVSAKVSWADAKLRTEGAFGYLDGDAEPGSGRITVTNIANISELEIDAGVAGMTGTPVRFTTTAAPGSDLRLTVTGFADTPSYMLRVPDSSLVTLVDSNPLRGSLVVQVPAGTTLDARVIHNPGWNGVLTSLPNPVSVGQQTTIMMDMVPGSTRVYLIVAVNEVLYQAKGLKLTALAVPPAIIMSFALNASGDKVITPTIPNDPGLAGFRLPLQAISTNAANAATGASNLWGLYLE